MKKFDVTVDGEWVKTEEAEALEQLNKEMLGMLKACNLIIQGLQIGTEYRENFIQDLQSVIAKAEQL